MPRIRRLARRGCTDLKTARKTGDRGEGGEGTDAIRRPRALWPAKRWSGQGPCAFNLEGAATRIASEAGGGHFGMYTVANTVGSRPPLGASPDSPAGQVRRCLSSHNTSSCHTTLKDALPHLCKDLTESAISETNEMAKLSAREAQKCSRNGQLFSHRLEGLGPAS